MLTELGQRLRYECPCSLGHHDLAPVAGGRDPGGAVQLAPRVALTGQEHLARMQAHPHAHGSSGQRLLTLGGCLQRLPRIGKRTKKGIALSVDFNAAMRGNSFA